MNLQEAIMQKMDTVDPLKLTIDTLTQELRASEHAIYHPKGEFVLAPETPPTMYEHLLPEGIKHAFDRWGYSHQSQKRAWLAYLGAYPTVVVEGSRLLGVDFLRYKCDESPPRVDIFMELSRINDNSIDGTNYLTSDYFKEPFEDPLSLEAFKAVYNNRRRVVKVLRDKYGFENFETYNTFVLTKLISEGETPKEKVASNLADFLKGIGLLERADPIVRQTATQSWWMKER